MRLFKSLLKNMINAAGRLHIMLGRRGGMCYTVPTRQRAPGFGHLFGTAAQDLSQHIQIHALGEADKIQCRFDLTAHGVDIAQGIGCGDLPEGIGVIDHRREEIHRLHQSNVLGDAVDGR